MPARSRNRSENRRLRRISSPCGPASSSRTDRRCITKANGASGPRELRPCASSAPGSQEHVAATADSTGVVALLYRVQDRFNSYFDAKSLCSYKLMKHTEEGSHRRETVITYDYARGKAVLEERNLKDNQQKKTENDIPGCVTDVLSGIFYVASLPLQQGANYTFPLNDGRQDRDRAGARGRQGADQDSGRNVSDHSCGAGRRLGKF